MLLAFRNGDDALCTFAVGHLLIDLRRNVLTPLIHLHHLVTAGDTVLDLAQALDHEKPFLAAEGRLLLEGHHMLDTGVLDTGNDIFFHNRCKITKILRNFARRTKKLTRYDTIQEMPA